MKALLGVVLAVGSMACITVIAASIYDLVTRPHISDVAYLVGCLALLACYAGLAVKAFKPRPTTTGEGEA